ncbi:antirestriction protein ArdA [Sphingomonas naphthae]|uniref:Antirestriction protein ArdA n=1 Tax=Sphingomonas naphthae TaxID=1813468 RepID=A0ABY7TMP0_9SPHN|nr:antirestriction protein ArdA [Sphingomonas naphthae]WCT74293.1 antirestriction protein ArdA [Sphingomonas naphthae]
MGDTLTKTDQPRIYVACLAAYNNGILHGAWIEADRGAWQLWGDTQAMLAASPIADAEEWAIHDFEGFGRNRIHESDSFERIAGLAAFIAEHGALGAALIDHCDGDLERAREVMEDGYLGCHASLADYVQELTEDANVVPEQLRYYINWQAMARDAELNGDLFTIETAWNAVHVFAGH